MSEYWKSTPKYWCKHCKTFVRDTKLEKANHEATPKHQGNLKRFLRDLHRGHEKDEKDKERAKAEVARLNGMTAGGASGTTASSSMSGYGRGTTSSLPKPHPTPSQRKQQLAQLVEMGVAIPDEFRPDMAMAGEWQVTSERIVEPDSEKNSEAMALGVRKRVPDEEEVEEIEAKKRRWGSTYRSHPIEEDDGDLDALLNNVIQGGKAPAVKVEIKDEAKENGDEVIKTEPQVNTDEEPAGLPLSEEHKMGIKREPSDGETALPPASKTVLAGLEKEGADGEDSAVGSILFKKRKAKNIRQK